MENLKIYVLFRSSKKTGKVDKTITAAGRALLELWALQNTTSSKVCMIFERDTGKLVYSTYGTKDGFPKVKDARDGELGICEDYGIPLDILQSIKDDRFDNLEEE